MNTKGIQINALSYKKIQISIARDKSKNKRHLCFEFQASFQVSWLSNYPCACIKGVWLIGKSNKWHLCSSCHIVLRVCIFLWNKCCKTFTLSHTVYLCWITFNKFHEMPPFSPRINYQDVLIKYMILRISEHSELYFSCAGSYFWFHFIRILAKFKCFEEKINANPSWINKLSNVFTYQSQFLVCWELHTFSNGRMLWIICGSGRRVALWLFFSISPLIFKEKAMY